MFCNASLPSKKIGLHLLTQVTGEDSPLWSISLAAKLVEYSLFIIEHMLLYAIVAYCVAMCICRPYAITVLV